MKALFDTTNSNHARLFAAVKLAHAQSVFRQNPSSVAFQVAWLGSGDLGKSLTAALATLGGKHAPLAETYELLASRNPIVAVRELLFANRKVPGWGTSFKDDEFWRPVAKLLETDFPERHAALREITAELHKHNILIEPNPSAYTASAGMALGLPKHLTAWLFVAGRLDAWCSLTLGGT